VNAQDVLIAHGEKIAVGIVAAWCLWQVVDVYTSDAIRASEGLRKEVLETKWKEIESTTERSPPPTLIPPRDYLGQMQGRFAQPIAAAPGMAWITAHPDLPPTDTDRLFLYAYDVLPPTVTVTDSIGSLQLSVALPEAVRPADRRHADAPAVTWTRRDRAGDIRNTAGVLGVIIEVKVGGAAAWQPLPADGKAVEADGFVALDRIRRGPLAIDVLEPWAEHRFQARLAVRATGLPLAPTAAQIGRDTPTPATVLVWRGRFTPPGEDNIVWPVQADRLRRDPAAYLASTIPPEDKPRAWAKLAPDERLYLGPESAVATVLATADVRFALEKVVPGSTAPAPAADPADPAATATVATPATAHILITRRIPDPRGGAPRWIAPRKFVVAVGDAVGQEGTTVDDPFAVGSKRIENLSTAFVLDSVTTTGRRIVSLTVATRARTGVPGQRDISFKENSRNARSAVLRNVRTGATLTLMVLDVVPAPAPAGTLVWPWQFMTGLDERAGFLADPAAFRSFGKEPPRPAPYEPGTGPLVELARTRPDLGQINTDTTYYQFGDDRLVWWDHVNKREAWFPDRPSIAAPTPAAPTGEAGTAPVAPAPAP
jgi:hypothetical protein